uniref:Putative phage repressor n=1 Tax=Nitratidesulfovibrio vulgaris (strain DSM 19637 / Miyazaki F) TaxID=883 RepID=B8DK71_NITV9
MIGRRIEEIRGKVSRESFAAELGVHAQTLARYEKGERLPDSTFLENISKRFGIAPAWLLLGEGPKHSAERPESLNTGTPFAPPVLTPATGESHVIECTDCQIMLVPMVEARLSAGTGSFEVGEDVERRYAFRTDFLMRKGQPSSMVLMRVTGDSMEPDIKHNDVVLIDQSQRVPRPGLLYAVGVEDLVYLKSVNAEPGKLVLSSYNPDYPPIEVDARGDLSNGIRIIGRAVWVGRELN